MQYTNIFTNVEHHSSCPHNFIMETTQEIVSSVKIMVDDNRESNRTEEKVIKRLI